MKIQSLHEHELFLQVEISYLWQFRHGVNLNFEVLDHPKMRIPSLISHTHIVQHS